MLSLLKHVPSSLVGVNPSSAAAVDWSRRCRHERGCCSNVGVDLLEVGTVMKMVVTFRNGGRDWFILVADLELFSVVVSRFRCCC